MSTNLKTKITLPEALAGGAVLATVANYAFVKFGFHPYLYCWLHPLVQPIYAAWAEVFNVLAGCFLFYALIRRRSETILWALVVFFVIYGLPIFADTIFKLGGSCD